ncbi:hypothetical protein HK405_013156, partial [Cladochytrium tenue]
MATTTTSAAGAGDCGILHTALPGLFNASVATDSAACCAIDELDPLTNDTLVQVACLDGRVAAL